MDTDIELDLSVAAHSIGLNVETLIRHAAHEQLTIIVMADEWGIVAESGSAKPISGAVHLLPEDLQASYVADYVHVRKVKQPGEDRVLELETPIQLPRGQLYVATSEFDRFCRERALSPQLVQTTPPYLDEHHPYFATELAAAVQAWTALFADGKFEPDGRAVKAHIDKWLRKTYPKFGQAARDRIATLINPKTTKTGGAPKTPTK